MASDPSLTASEASTLHARVVDLWRLLLTGFCSSSFGPPSDLDVTFPTLVPILVRAMGDGRYRELGTIIPTSLKVLTAGVRERVEAAEPLSSNGGVEGGGSSNEEEGAGDGTTADNSDRDDALSDYRIVSEASVKLLPALFKLVEALHGTDTSGSATSAAKRKKDGGGSSMDLDDDGASARTGRGRQKQQQAAAQDNAQRVQAVTDAIAELARICPRPFLQTLVKKILQRLLAAAQSEDGDDETDRICTLLGLAQALVSSQSLDADSVSLLYRTVRPFIRSDENDSRVQKRAYKVMAEICDRYGSTFVVGSDEQLDEITELFIGSIATCQVSSRHMRLRCMTCIVQSFDSSNEQHMAVIPKIMGEVLLCLKDSNGKTREAAYQLLLTMAQVRDDMADYFQIVLAALGAQTPHMRSAAVMALSRLVFEYARMDETVHDMLPALLQTVVVLFDEKSREVIKSVVGFVRVGIAAMSPEQLEPLLPEVVGGLMKYNRGKDRFRSKIKIILKKLARTYGFERITPLVPEDDARLMTHMRKLAERAARRKAANRPDGRGDGQTVFDDMMESDEDDSDDGRTLMTGATGFTRMTAASGKSIRSAAIARSERAKSVRSAAQSTATAKTAASSSAPRIKAERGGEVIDMLDPKMAKNVHFADEGGDDGFSDDDDDDGIMEFDEVGRLVINEPLDIDRGFVREEANNADDDDENEELKGGGKRRRISKFESAKNERAEANNTRKAQKKARNEPKSLGASYKSKKAGGDVKKKGQKYEPYAYVPLDGKSYSKKNRGKAVAQMSTVVRDKGGKKRKRR